MKKFLNKFLNNKSDFTNDEKLKSLNEQYFFLLGEAKKLLNHVIEENIRYYIKYKKMYLIKLLAVILTYACLGVGIVFGGLYLFNLTITKVIPKKAYVLTVYLPDTDTIAQQECDRLKIRYNIIFLPNPKKDWMLYKEAFHNIETKGTSDAQSYLMQSSSGAYWGRYQLGHQALVSVGLGAITWKEFSTNPDMQEGAFLSWMRERKISMQPEIDKYCGTYMRGIEITESGIISMAHNVGDGDAKAFFNSGGRVLPTAGNYLPFLKLGGYNLRLK